MCCLFAVLVFFGPRLGILVWWLMDSARWSLAFTGSFLWPLLGFLFLPWTTLMYVVVFPGGVNGFDWVWLGLALLADIASYAGSGYGNRDKVPGYSSKETVQEVDVEVTE